jgi:hypothetical protein
MQRPALITLAIMVLAAPSLSAQAPVEGSALETRVWLDRGDEPVLRRGETVRVYYRAAQDAYAAIFRIDTDGRVSMIFPQTPSSDTRVDAGRDYRLVLPNSPVWRVNDDPGVGYFFMVASPEPLDFSAFPFDPAFGWDLGAVGAVVYEDPYLAIDAYVAELIPDWDVAPYALDFVTYSVGDTYTYPRFLCYDCHEARPYASWNPYDLPCTTVRVVIWDDPYFYPYYRYSGSNVVVARRVVTQPRYAVAARAPGDSFRPLVRSRVGPPRTVPEFKEPPGTPVPVATPRRASQVPADAAPRPTLQRRDPTPSARLPVRSPPTNSGSQPSATPGRDTPDPRIVRPTRPSAPATGSPTTRPSGGTTTVPSRPSVRPSLPSATPSRSGTSPSRPAPQSRPTARPTAPSSRPSARPAAPPSRPTTQPSSRPTARPAAPRTQPSAPSRPTVEPRSNEPRRPGG